MNDRFYRLIVDSGNIQARVALTSSDELLTRGDRVTLLVYGYDEKRNYVWGALPQGLIYPRLSLDSFPADSRMLRIVPAFSARGEQLLYAG